jgi:hypothetical protein
MFALLGLCLQSDVVASDVIRKLSLQRFPIRRMALETLPRKSAKSIAARDALT